MPSIYDHFKQHFVLNLQSELPIYRQIENYVTAQVRLGTFQENDKMISENELCDLLNISRTTVRQAMDALYKKGIVQKIRGKGTFIASEKIQRNINQVYNFSESMTALGHQPSSIVLSSEIITADEELAEILKLPEFNRKVFKLERIRKADDMPMIWETSYIPYYLCPSIETVDFEHRSLYNVLEKIFQLEVKTANETIEAIVLTEEMTRLLECPQMAGFFIHRTAYLDEHTVLEYTHSITRADKCTFQLNWQNGKQEEMGRVYRTDVE
ncbi:GntR family transcriptional regulator [Caviibacterium pharyngocola]|uniref:GntR family transcriptional regulator n=1 Tax=Caviibacterium pharyngocola TaxID=28159 RepID=A0A2M8RUC4_9PAST|nr:GntR family transcriptional regulator [Caviibacterium pharyngocola]PJG82481.1 GntR family transcriptional regulator [Caviibacterium pharyngocola]